MENKLVKKVIGPVLASALLGSGCVTNRPQVYSGMRQSEAIVRQLEDKPKPGYTIKDLSEDVAKSCLETVVPALLSP